MINNFLIINCTGKNNSIGVKINNKFFKEKLQKNIQANNLLVSNIISFNNKYGVKLDDKYAILVNLGPGSYSSIRVSLSVAKGIKIVHGSKIFGYNNDQLSDLSLENIENLIKNKHLEDKFIKPIYDDRNFK
tara:strand:- start:73 stop:468 length:396 start_codon:yes stop_codon:yes gene_type:complete